MEWLMDDDEATGRGYQRGRENYEGGRCGEEEGSWLAIEMLREVAHRQDVKDTEEIVQWRSISHEGMNDLCGK